MSAAEQLADSILRAAGSGLHNYTMAGTRKAIIDAASEAIRPPSIQRRVDACLFACSGISNAALEDGIVDNLVSLLIQYRDDMRHPPSLESVGRRLDAINAALAKVQP